MGLEKKLLDDELLLYNALQFQHIESRYVKYLADTGKKMTLTHYVVNVYVPSGDAKKFHEDYRCKNGNDTIGMGKRHN